MNSTKNRHRLLGFVLLLTALTLAPSSASAQILFYGGDYDNNDALPNSNGVPVNTGTSSGSNVGYFLVKSLVYQDFVVPVGQTWTVSSLFSDNQIGNYSGTGTSYATATTATWEIRSGMSAGNGGTLVASGDSSTVTQTAITAQNGYTYAYPESRITATISAVTLTAGTYWVAVAPDDDLGYFIDKGGFAETSSGANAVGTLPSNDQTFISNNLGSYTGGSIGQAATYESAAQYDGSTGTLDFSIGVNGTFTVVPEPASLLMVGLGVAGIAGYLRRRSNRRSH
jgi:hypothetical protein